MQRPSVPEAERLIGEKHPVLSHGFVVLVDYMGDDAAIVQAARVSYGQGTKSVRDDRGLIRYLMRHRHTTPFEMVEFKFLVRLPIYVARQWIRHRTACLAEGTHIYFDLPGGTTRGRPKLYSLTVEDLWKRWQPTFNKSRSHQRNPTYRRDRVQAMHLRQLNEDTRAFGHTQIEDVVRSGVKPVFEMCLEDGKSIQCTSDHRFLFSDGWFSLAERTGLREEGGRAVWSEGEFLVSVNGAEFARPAFYQDRNWLEREYILQGRAIPDLAEACGVGPETILAWLRRFGIPVRSAPQRLFVKNNLWGAVGGATPKSAQRKRIRVTGAEPYKSREWLERMWVVEALTASRIATLCGASPSTIRKWLTKFRLTNHPAHESYVRFRTGDVPWNLGKTYRLGPRTPSAEMLRAIRRARSGAASNFWKGGMSSNREGIGRWTTQVAATIHARNHWTCQLCYQRRGKLHAHHIVPVWADLSRARDTDNLTTLCDACHREVHKNEVAFVERLGGPPVRQEWVRRPRIGWNKLTVARLEKIRGFRYVGERMTYELTVSGPHRNFVANGIVTHNSVNEYSARYSIVPDEFEVPIEDDVRRQSGRNRQGRAEALPKEVTSRFREDLERVSREAYEAYARALKDGVARETARALLPVAYYTQWYWKINLHNLFHFLSLRLDPHSQEEIRLYARELARIARTVCPVAFEAFEDFQIAGLDLSRREQAAVRALLDGKTATEACAVAGLPLLREDGTPMSTGEGVEFLEKLERIRTLE